MLSVLFSCFQGPHKARKFLSLLQVLSVFGGAPLTCMFAMEAYGERVSLSFLIYLTGCSRYEVTQALELLYQSGIVHHAPRKLWYLSPDHITPTRDITALVANTRCRGFTLGKDIP